MKRKPLVLAFALLLVVGVVLWGVNYRLDHPPMTRADKEFRAMVAGADNLELWEGANPSHSIMNSTELAKFIENIRFSESLVPAGIFPPGSGVHPKDIRVYSLLFSSRDYPLASCMIFQTKKEIVFGGIPASISQNSISSERNYYLNPRFNRRLNRALDAYLPQRVRP